jgi:hypothetical protein
MAQNDIDAFPADAAGITPTSAASVWGFGLWTELTTGFAFDIYIISLSFQITNIPALDTTVEQLFEIGIGTAGAEITEVQVPYNVRNDTQVGYYLTRPEHIFLPEPIEITAGNRIAVRVADSLVTAITYNGVKIMYKEGATAYTPVDPMGMMGIYGL